MSEAAPRGQAERAEETRDLLVRTAIRLFAEKGVNGVSLRAVGEAAGQKNTAAVHYHFGDRDRLLMAAVDRILAALAEPVDAEMARLVRVDRAFCDRSGIHAVLAALFLPMVTLPLRHPAWGRDAVKLLSRVVTGEAGQIAREFNEKVNIHTERIIDDLSARSGITDRDRLATRLDFAFVSILAVLASAEFLRPLVDESELRQRYLAEVPDLLDFAACGFGEGVRG